MRLLVVLAAIAALLLPACGSDDEPAADKAAKPAVTPFPTIDRADLTPATTYTTQQFKPEITLTMPEGEWIADGADGADHVDSSALAFHHMTQVFPPETGGTKPGDAVPGPDDFAAWLTSHPHLTATKPKPVDALGLKGVALDVRVKSSQPQRYKDCGKVLGDCVVMFVGKVEPASALKAQKPAFDALLASATAAR